MKQKKVQHEGFFVIKTDHTNEPCIVLETNWTSTHREFIANNKIRHLRLSEHMGWKDSNIDFLDDLNLIEGIEIYSNRIKNINPLQHFTTIKHLALECPFNSFCFSKLIELDRLFLRWRPKSDDIFSLKNLTHLNIVNYPDFDLSSLSKMIKLKSIKLVSRNLRSLTGLENFQALKSVDLFQCTKLENIKAIQSCKSIESIHIESCKKIPNISPIKSQIELKHLSLNNCGDIESLTPIALLNNLETLSFTEDTKIIDGNLTFISNLKNLKKVIFNNRKHYSNKREAINLSLSYTNK